jgi:hypothetical protein
MGHMTQSPELNGLQQQDYDLSLSVLLAVSAALKKHSVVSSVELDNLRIRLSDQQSLPPLSLFASLEVESHPFLEILKSRYSQGGLAQMLLRLSLRRALNSQRQSLIHYAQHILESSKAFFNRRIHIYIGDRCLRGSLLSTMMAEYAGRLDQSVVAMENLIYRISVMPRANFRSFSEVDQKIDAEIAETLDLSSVEASSFPGLFDQEILLEWTTQLKVFQMWCEGFVNQLNHGLKKRNTQGAYVFLENMKLESKRLESIHLPQVDHLESWERLRIDILKTCESWTVSFSDFQTELFEVIFRFDNFLGASSKNIPDDIRSNLASSMITQGVDPLRTKDALSALLLYLENNGITASEMLPTELKKIDPALNPQVLEKLQTFGTEDSILSNTSEKDDSWEKYAELLKKFQQKLAKAGVLAVFLMIVLSCGVKKTPVGQLEDLRPEIPYKLTDETEFEDSNPTDNDEKDYEDER